MSLRSGHTEKLTGFSESGVHPVLISDSGERIGRVSHAMNMGARPAPVDGRAVLTSHDDYRAERIRCTHRECGLHRVTYLRFQSIGN